MGAGRSGPLDMKRRPFLVALAVLLALPAGAPGAAAPAAPEATGAWTSNPSLSKARYALAAAAVNGKVYALGGFNGSGFVAGTLKTVEEYDPGTNAWAAKPDMPTGR